MINKSGLMNKYIACVFLLITVFSCNNDSADKDEVAPASLTDDSYNMVPYSVVNIYPHDTSSFTEGLLIHKGQLYESTGGSPAFSHFKSWFGPVDLKTGRPLKKIMLDTAYFGEGINILNGKLYQLTWQNRKGFIYDVKTLKKTGEFEYTGEGWSLTHDSSYLIMSDGSSNLRYLDPVTLKVQKIVSVKDNNGPVANINELEYINGDLYANIWGTNYIYKIDPASGQVKGRMDLSTVVNEVKTRYPQSLEMNGIAFDTATGKMYITGKAWPSIYEISLN